LKHACSYSFSWKKVDGNYKGNDMNEVWLPQVITFHTLFFWRKCCSCTSN
jgi:hypothetical protein